MTISRADALLGQYSFKGMPWVNVTTKTTFNVDTLGYAFNGEPWYGIELIETTTSNMKSISGVEYNSIKSINGVSILNVKSFNGV